MSIIEWIRNQWARIGRRPGSKRMNTVFWLIAIGLASISVRSLMELGLDGTALLYVGIPYLISLAIAAVRPLTVGEHWWHGYRDHVIKALMIFLASSIVLYEGFICVLFFMPIYFLIVSISFTLAWMRQRAKKKSSKMLGSLVPLLVMMLALEGTTPQTTIERESQVSLSRIVDRSAHQIFENLTKPIDLQKDRHWLLSIFPMPYEINAGSLKSGDVHTVRTRYHRWFVTNTHEGELQLLIDDVSDRYVRTRILKDTTFFSSYVTLHGTQIDIRELGNGQAELTLTINYQRKLDPAWYFGPLQKFGMEKMADFLLDEVIIRE